MELPVVRERRVTPSTIDGDADEVSVMLAELGKNLVVERHLVATNGTPVSRVKRENDRTPTKLAQAEHLVGRSVQREVGRRSTGGKDR